MKYHIKTFGCQMNVSDSERLAAFLETNNLAPTSEIASADLVIFNTCGIKQTAENRAYSMINNLRKKRKQDVKIIMTGCLANRPDVQKRMKDKVDLFTEIKDFPEEFGIMNQEFGIKNKNSHNSKFMIHDSLIPSKERIDYLSINPKYDNTFQAYVPIMTGCNNFCAYCVVPYARGREVSRPAEEVIREIKDLVKNGYKHIFLLGQNVNSYTSQVHKVYNVRKEKNEKINFAKLLEMIDLIHGKFWISFVSSHPKDMDNQTIETIAKLKKVCENIHLPIQAGNDNVLHKMNRKYTQKHYLKTVKKIKNAFKKYKPDALFSISSDIIVGFPGETKAQFLDSAKVMKKAKFDMVYFGQFSPRPATVAWKMKDNVSQKEKMRREKLLNEILKKTALTNNKKYLGKKIEVLIDHIKSDDSDHVTGKNGFYFGRTRTGKNVKVTSKKKNLIGKIIKAKITKANIWNLEGELI